MSRIWNPFCPDFETYNNRLSSFKYWPLDRFIPSKILSLAGFFHLDKRDHTVMCYYCGLVLSEWELYDNPIFEHRRHQVNCFHLDLVSSQPKIDDIYLRNEFK